MSAVYDDENIALRPTTVYVDLDALEQNIIRIKAQVAPAQIMGVVKANAYGHGLVRTSKELLRFGVDQLCVAFLEEGVALRKAGETSWSHGFEAASMCDLLDVMGTGGSAQGRARCLRKRRRTALSVM